MFHSIRLQAGGVSSANSTVQAARLFLEFLDSLVICETPACTSVRKAGT